ncbi:unnamed protein product [Owenia fusiformis]|uniref:Uncharacterized protein n=1 Tax=Owenia fusiformis TaxID=6347 RepID=A0A8J1XGH9_OWEFU|nr:unnamed protein product [Owenia fusiformis]
MMSKNQLLEEVHIEVMKANVNKESCFPWKDAKGDNRLLMMDPKYKNVLSPSQKHGSTEDIDGQLGATTHVSNTPKANRDRIMQKAYNLRSWTHMPKSPSHQPPPRKRRCTHEPMKSSSRTVTSQSESLSMSQVVSQSGAQSMSQLMQMSQPVAHPLSQPLMQYIDRPIPQSFPQSVPQTMTQPLSQPKVQPMVQPMTQSMSQYIIKQKMQPLSLPTIQPMAQLMTHVSNSIQKPTEQSSPKPRKKLVFSKESSKKKTNAKDNRKQEQALMLYEGFLENQTPTEPQLVKLSNATGLSPKHIKAWFTNKRHIYKSNKTSFMLTYKKIKDKAKFKKWLDDKTIPDDLGVKADSTTNGNQWENTDNLEPNLGSTSNENDDTLPLGDLTNVYCVNKYVYPKFQEAPPIKDNTQYFKHDTPMPKDNTPILMQDTPRPKFEILQQSHGRLQVKTDPTIYVPTIHRKTNTVEYYKQNAKEPNTGIHSTAKTVKYNHDKYLKYVDLLDGFSKNIEDDLDLIDADENSFEERYPMQDVAHSKDITQNNDINNYQMSQSVDHQEVFNFDAKTKIDDLQIHNQYLNKNAGQLPLVVDLNFSQKYQSPGQMYQNLGQYQNSGQLYQKPCHPYQSSGQSYQNPDQSYQNTHLSYQNPGQSFQSPIQPYQNFGNGHQSPIQSCQNLGQLYQSPNQSYPNPYQSYQSPSQLYQNPGQSSQNIGHINPSYDQHGWPSSCDFYTWYHPDSNADTTDRRRNVSAPGWVGCQYRTDLARHSKFTPNQHNRQIDHLIAFTLMSQYQNTKPETRQNVTQNNTIAVTSQSTGKAHTHFPTYKTTNEQYTENSTSSQPTWMPNITTNNEAWTPPNITTPKPNIAIAPAKEAMGVLKKNGALGGNIAMEAQVNTVPATTTANVTMAPRVGTEVMTAMLLTRTAVALNSLSSEPDDVINDADCTPLAQDDPVFVFDEQTPETHNVEGINPLDDSYTKCNTKFDDAMKSQGTEDVNPIHDSYQGHTNYTSNNKIDDSAFMCDSTDTSFAKSTHLLTKQDTVNKNDASVNSELEYDLEGMIDDFKNCNQQSESIDVETFDAETNCDILQSWEADFLMRLTQKLA